MMLLVMGMTAQAASKSITYKAYRNWIKGGCQNEYGDKNSFDRFCLVKINSDRIPELIGGRAGKALLSGGTHQNEALMEVIQGEGFSVPFGDTIFFSQTNNNQLSITHGLFLYKLDFSVFASLMNPEQ